MDIGLLDERLTSRCAKTLTICPQTMEDSGFKKQNWDVGETELLLEILKELDIKNCLDGRKVRNTKLFRVAHRRMTAAGYHRSVDQLKFRWKFLKSAYYKCKRDPDAASQHKIHGWWRYQKTMAAIMETRHALAGAGVINSDRNEVVTEDSNEDSSMPLWSQPCSGATNQDLDLIVGVMFWIVAVISSLPCGAYGVVLFLQQRQIAFIRREEKTLCK